MMFIVTVGLLSCQNNDDNNPTPNTNCKLTGFVSDDEEYILSYAGRFISKYQYAEINGSNETSTLSYNGDSLLVSVRYQSTDFGNYIDSFIYDSNKRLVNHITYGTNALFTTKVFDSREVFVYNASNQIIVQRDSTADSPRTAVIKNNTYQNNRLFTTYSYTYDYDEAEAFDYRRDTVFYTSTPNNLLNIYKLPSYVFMDYYFEPFNADLLVSEIRGTLLDDSGNKIGSDIFKYTYTFDNGKIVKIIENDNGFNDEFIRFLYTCE